MQYPPVRVFTILDSNDSMLMTSSLIATLLRLAASSRQLLSA